MKVTGIAVYTDIKPSKLLGKTAVMVDTLRASSTIITAIANGCDRIVPTSEPNEAVAISKISEGNVLLCGEIAAQKVGGFDLGNSPLEYTKEVVEEKILIYSTTNGSNAVKSLVEGEDVLIGAFLNADAVAQMVCEISRDTMLVCAGTRGKFSTDDVIGMGCIIDRMVKYHEDLDIDDLGQLALRIYRDAKLNMLAAMEDAAQFRYLKQLKMYDDLEYCMREDLFSVVPQYKEGVISK